MLGADGPGESPLPSLFVKNRKLCVTIVGSSACHGQKFFCRDVPLDLTWCNRVSMSKPTGRCEHSNLKLWYADRTKWWAPHFGRPYRGSGIVDRFHPNSGRESSSSSRLLSPLVMILGYYRKIGGRQEWPAEGHFTHIDLDCHLRGKSGAATPPVLSPIPKLEIFDERISRLGVESASAFPRIHAFYDEIARVRRSWRSRKDG